MVGLCNAQGTAATQGKGKPSATAQRPRVYANLVQSNLVQSNLVQLMRGVLFPNANVVFFAQDDNPADVKPANDPSLATDPLANTYGKWDAVENSALALSEAGQYLNGSREPEHGLLQLP